MSIANELQTLTINVQGVLDGKASIAQAITSKGVPTADDASFETLAVNVGLIEGGGEAEIFDDGEYGLPYTKNFVFKGSKFPLNNLYKNAKHMETLECPNATNAGYNQEIFRNCTSLRTVVMPVYSGGNNYTLGGLQNLQSVQIGSIGHPVTSLHNLLFSTYSDTPSYVQFTCTIYVSDGVTVPIANHPFGATNAIFIYRSSSTGEIIPT